MGRLTEEKIILIKRKTRLEELVARYNTIDQARFYIEHLGSDFSDYLAEDEQYREAVAEAYGILEAMARVQVVDREFVPNFIFGDGDTVVVLGQDGLVANTLKYLTRQRLVGVNPDAARWDGVLLPFKVKELRLVVPEVLKGKRPVKEVSMARAALNDGQELFAVNDLFIGQRTHVSARYLIQYGGRKELQSSSGIIVSTGLGSSGWLKSVLAGAAGILACVSRQKVEMPPERQRDWGSNELYYSVREPFPSRTTQTGLVFGRVDRDHPLKILSQMPENGVIFSDGMESDFLRFNSGMEAVITVAEKKGQLVV